MASTTTMLSSYNGNFPSNSHHYVRALSSGGGQQQPPKLPKRVGPAIGLATSAFLFLGKGKSILSALKLTKFASFGSLFLSIGTYSMFFGLPYAAGMVGLILVHETGHALVMKHLRIPFSPMVFVPFVGAAVAMKESPKNVYQEALVAFGGPVLGSLGAGAVCISAHATDSQLCFALADFGFMINLFNMMPLGMLDGGRITSAISPYAGLVGLGMGGGMIYYDVISNPIFYLVMMAGGYQTFTKLYNPRAHDATLPRNYYNISNMQKLGVTGGYFGVIGALLLAMEVNAQYKKSPETLQREREYGLR
uniref:Peptidase M50 domain-containing protein n=1 Tax=Ditylum brightwellii TaxID=49249 RepID=A0A7S2A3Z5_9STRA|mmetsp:Transcript_8245/g.12330  ORF Transcript_8245/g.12330 Transcript_8245/m.12330 type:complete len:307 (+) Transcript_8245:401-1321(+)